MLADLEFNYDETTAAMDKFSQKDIDDLRVWTQKVDRTKHIPKDLTDKQLVLFYNACYGDMQQTKLCVEHYYKCRKRSPDFFNNRVFDTSLKTASQVCEYSVLPAKSCEGYDIIFNRLCDYDAEKFDLVNEYKLLLMTVDLYLTKRGPQRGVIFIFDVQFKLGHLMKVNPLVMRRAIEYLQDALPVRMQAMHVLNAGPVLDKALSLVKPFMYKKFFGKMIYHTKDEDLEKFYKIIPRSALPPIYGGTLPDTQSLNKKCIEQLQSLESYFKSEEEQRLAAL